MTVSALTPTTAGRRILLRQALVPASAIAACALIAAHAPTEVRGPAVIAFLCIVPGAALVGLLEPDSLALEIALAVGLSVALTGAAATVLVYAHLWSTTAVVLIVAAISIAAAVRDVGSVRSAPAHAELAAEIRHPPAAHGVGRPYEGRLVRTMPPAPAVHDLDAAPGASLLDILLDELPPADAGGRHRRHRRALAQLDPQERAALLSWPALQRSLTQRVVEELDPQLWLVDDLEQRLERHGQPGSVSAVTRGVVVTGVSPELSFPVAWRLRDEDQTRGAKAWRLRLALDVLERLPTREGKRRVVAAGGGFGSLVGLRRELESRAVPYLLRVDPVTAARELRPARARPSAAVARQIVQERLVVGSVIARSASQSHLDRADGELVVLRGAERLLVCERSASGRPTGFWLSNLPEQTPHERLASLVRLAGRHRERVTPDFLVDALVALADGLLSLSPATGATGSALGT